MDHDRPETLDSPPAPGATPPLPMKLGIGVEGGFQTEEDKYEIISTYSIVNFEAARTTTTTTTNHHRPVIILDGCPSCVGNSLFYESLATTTTT